MDLISENLHLVLTYVGVANRAGVSLSPEQLHAFADGPKPRGPVVRNTFADFARITSLISGGTVTRPAEPVIDFLLRVEWVTDSNERVELTPLGRAVLADADRPPVLDPADSPLSVVIDPEDPLAYTRVFELIAASGPGLLVDRYLKFDGLSDLMSISLVDRVLTGDDARNRRLDIFAHALGAMQDGPQMRTVEADKLHDRFFIPDHGPVFILGSSLNSISKRPGVVTPIADGAGGAAIRRAYARLWSKGTVVERREPPVDPPSNDTTAKGREHS